jgi:hypothetical protein
MARDRSIAASPVDAHRMVYRTDTDTDTGSM